ncbi:MAG: MMPL family transporter [Gemmatimonadetes bacterium]|nr:MMPL family transporter [Gemmatimonadota bacterium]
MTALSRAVVRFRYYIIAFWLIVAALAIPRAARVTDVLETGGQLLRSTEAQLTRDIILESFERPIVSFMAVVVTGPVPIDSQAYHLVLENLSAAALQEPYIDQVVSYLTRPDPGFVSDDRMTTFFIATVAEPYATNAGQVTPWLRDAMNRRAARTPGAEEYEILVTGGPALDFDSRAVTAEDARRGERRSLIPAGIVLVLAFGALAAAVLPIIIGMFAISCALAAVYVAAAFHGMSIFVLTIVTMVGLAVGIDYSLLIVTRFREEMNRGMGPKESAVRTLLTAGRAVITSGLTVIVGFASLLLTPLIETRSVGIGGMLVVTAAVLLSVTLLPAVLAIAGRSIDWPHWLARRLAWYHRPTAWERWARWLSHHPGRALVIGLAITGLLTWPLLHIEIGLPTSGWFPSGTESSIGATVIERTGSRGALLPVQITFRAPEGQRIVSSRYIGGLIRFSDSLLAEPRISSVRGPVNLGTGMSRLGLLSLYGNLERARDRYPEFFQSYIAPDGRTTLMDVTLADTTSLPGAMEVVKRVREMAAGDLRGLDLVEIHVGGFAAASLDLQEDLLKRFPTVIGLVLAITAAMLLVAFRSVLVPLKAVVMNSLSVLGAFGMLVLVFQDGIGSGILGLEGPTQAIHVVIPVLVFAVAFGLSMDYEVFLLSRMKEAFDRTHKNDLATMEGLSVTASVITSAAAIMIIVFGTFAFSRVLAAKMMGFGLAVAVLLDATLIRMVLVPAFMHIAGRWNWWPGVRIPAEPEGPV